MTARREILLNAFTMNCVGHINHGLWTHPRDRSADYTKLSYWTDLAPRWRRSLRRRLHRRHRRRLRRLPGLDRSDGPRVDPASGQRPDAARARNGGRHPASRLRRHRQHGGGAPLHLRPPLLDARPPDGRADRLEHRHRLSRQRGAGRGARRHGRARRALRPGGRLSRLPLQALGNELGRRRGAARQGGARLRRPRRHPRGPARGALLPGRGYHLSEPSPQRTPSCSRPARRAAGNASPRVTPNASSSRPPTGGRAPHLARAARGGGRGRGAGRTISASSPGSASSPARATRRRRSGFSTISPMPARKRASPISPPAAASTSRATGSTTRSPTPDQRDPVHHRRGAAKGPDPAPAPRRPEARRAVIPSSSDRAIRWRPRWRAGSTRARSTAST